MKEWYEITYCARKNVYDEWIPAEWFILNAPFATCEEAETIQAKRREDLKGTDAEWPEADAAAKIVHRDELAQYNLKPLDSVEGSGQSDVYLSDETPASDHSDSSESIWWSGGQEQ